MIFASSKHIKNTQLVLEREVVKAAILLRKILQDRCLPVNFAKFLRTAFLENTSGRLLLSLLQNTETHWNNEISRKND